MEQDANMCSCWCHLYCQSSTIMWPPHCRRMFNLVPSFHYRRILTFWSFLHLHKYLTRMPTDEIAKSKAPACEILVSTTKLSFTKLPVLSILTRLGVCLLSPSSSPSRIGFLAILRSLPDWRHDRLHVWPTGWKRGFVLSCPLALSFPWTPCTPTLRPLVLFFFFSILLSHIYWLVTESCCVARLMITCCVENTGQWVNASSHVACMISGIVLSCTFHVSL